METKKFAPPPIRETVQQQSDKNAVTAALLGLFLGYYGVHNFYLGYKSKAVIQLILSLTLVGIFIAGPWAIVEAIMLFTGYIKTDAKGRTLRRS